MVQRATVRDHAPARAPANDYTVLRDLREALNDQVREAIVRHDRRAEAIARCDRAWIHMRLRDLHGPASHDGEQEHLWMLDDIRQARKAAEEVLGIRFLEVTWAGRSNATSCPPAAALEQLLDDGRERASDG